MDLKDVKAFIKLAKDEGVAELKYETKELKLSVNFVNSAPVSITHAATPISSSIVTAVSEKASVKPGHEVTSPFVGTFYAAPSPDKPNFVKVGDRVRKGQTLCILEAMKIMNEIESDIDGEVIEICVDNESLVEYGQALFRIKS